MNLNLIIFQFARKKILKLEPCRKLDLPMENHPLFGSKKTTVTNRDLGMLNPPRNALLGLNKPEIVLRCGGGTDATNSAWCVSNTEVEMKGKQLGEYYYKQEENNLK